MRTIVVGGHTRGVGKTAVVCGILRAFAGMRWTAVKVTPHPHVAAAGPAVAIYEEADGAGGNDTARFLAAGASRALLIQAGAGAAGEAAAVVTKLAEQGPVVVEGNSLVCHLAQELFLFVVRPECGEWKEAARGLLERADAVIVNGPGGPDVAGRVFRMEAPETLPPQLVRLLKTAGVY